MRLSLSQLAVWSRRECSRAQPHEVSTTGKLWCPTLLSVSSVRVPFRCAAGDECGQNVAFFARIAAPLLLQGQRRWMRSALRRRRVLAIVKFESASHTIVVAHELDTGVIWGALISSSASAMNGSSTTGLQMRKTRKSLAGFSERGLRQAQQRVRGAQNYIYATAASMVQRGPMSPGQES